MRENVAIQRGKDLVAWRYESLVDTSSLPTKSSQPCHWLLLMANHLLVTSQDTSVHTKSSIVLSFIHFLYSTAKYELCPIRYYLLFHYFPPSLHKHFIWLYDS